MQCVSDIHTRFSLDLGCFLQKLANVWVGKICSEKSPSILKVISHLAYLMLASNGPSGSLLHWGLLTMKTSKVLMRALRRNDDIVGTDLLSTL